MVPPTSRRVSRVPRYSGSCCLLLDFVYETFTLFGRLSQNRSTILKNNVCSPLPRCARTPVWALPISLAATLGIDCFFLFLRVLRCFSSGGSLCMTMDSSCSDGGFLRRVSPFRNPWIKGYLLLPEAYRSLSRLSSALSAKASTLCSCSLDLFWSPITRSIQ